MAVKWIVQLIVLFAALGVRGVVRLFLLGLPADDGLGGENEQGGLLQLALEASRRPEDAGQGRPWARQSPGRR